MGKIYEADSFIKTGGDGSEYLMADGTISTGPSGGVDVGTGTANKVAKFSDSDTITDSTITDDGTNVSMTGSITAPKLILGSSGNGYLEDDELIKVYGDQGILLESGDAVTITINEQIEIESGNLISDSNITAASLIKSGGTSSQFLKADGSVDSSTYSTTDTQLTTEQVQDIVGAMVQSNVEQSISVTYSDGDGKLNFDAGAAVYEHPAETAFTEAVDTGALTGAVVVSDIDMNISTNAFGHVTSAGMAVATRTLTLADLGFTGDADATNDQVLPTDFVSAAGGGTFSGSITAPTFNIVSADNYLKTDVDDLVHLYGDSGIKLESGEGVSLEISDEFSFDAGVVVAGSTEATSFIKTGGTSSQFLKADGSVDTNTYAVGTIPTDFVSAAGGGTFGGDIIADSFALPSGTSNRFLKADGSTDGTTYVSGAGSLGNIAYYSSTNAITDNSALAWDSLSDTLDIDGDIDATGNITADIIQAEGWTYIPQTFQSNFVHSTGNGYMNVPFNSLSDASSGGEQHFLVTPYSGYVYSVAFKNTATGNSMTATNMNFRVLINGVTQHTSTTQSFSAASRTYKGWVLTNLDATFNAGDDLRFQFRCTSGLWQDTCAVVVLKGVI